MNKLDTKLIPGGLVYWVVVVWKNITYILPYFIMRKLFSKFNLGEVLAESSKVALVVVGGV